MENNESVSVKRMNQLCDEYAALREKKENLARLTKEVNEEMDTIEAKMLAYLEESELDSFDGTKGKISVVNHFGVRVPQSVEEKKQFAKYLEKKKVFWEMATFNSRTLNSFYKQEMEYAAQECNTDFKIPGLGDPTHQKTLSFRRKAQ